MKILEQVEAISAVFDPEARASVMRDAGADPATIRKMLFESLRESGRQAVRSRGCQ